MIPDKDFVEGFIDDVATGPGYNTPEGRDKLAWAMNILRYCQQYNLKVEGFTIEQRPFSPGNYTPVARYHYVQRLVVEVK